VVVGRGEKGGVQGLHDAERAEAKVRAEDGEIEREELGGPAELGEQEDDDLEDDEQVVQLERSQHQHYSKDAKSLTTAQNAPAAWCGTSLPLWRG
jgi:hypothetical protein